MIRFHTELYPPDQLVTLRTNRDGWQTDHAGVFIDGAWQFAFDEANFGGRVEFKFVLEGTIWMDDPNLVVEDAVAGGEYRVDDGQVRFYPPPAAVVENGRVQQAFFAPNHDETHRYDVIVVGSGIGGGVLADQLADAGADVLVLEVGSLLFPTHVANLPRRLQVGRFDKHVWRLFETFRTVNYVNAEGSSFGGAQAFNLGGRSVFWGGLIPRLGAWELTRWPAPVRDYLLGTGYELARLAMNSTPATGSAYQENTKKLLAATLPDFDHLDAPVAVQYQGVTPLAIAAGMFSTADLLCEDRLVDDDTGPRRPVVNLNHAVQRILHDGTRATGVECYDLLYRRQRRYVADTVVLCAGTIESAKIALQSGLNDPSNLIGRGITDHPIWYTHFGLPVGSPHAAPLSSAKVWSRHRDVTPQRHTYNVVVELGADFNQGRYVDPDNLRRHREAKGDVTFGEIVFLFDAPLVEENWVQIDGPAHLPARVNVRPAPLPEAMLAEARDVTESVLAAFRAEPLQGETLELKQGGLGAVAHEVGTLRMSDAGNGVVDSDLKFRAYDNLYACDNSVFPTSPAANPSLTLGALALRLSRHLTRR